MFGKSFFSRGVCKCACGCKAKVDGFMCRPCGHDTKKNKYHKEIKEHDLDKEYKTADGKWVEY